MANHFLLATQTWSCKKNIHDSFSIKNIQSLYYLHYGNRKTEETKTNQKHIWTQKPNQGFSSSFCKTALSQHSTPPRPRLQGNSLAIVLKQAKIPSTFSQWHMKAFSIHAVGSIHRCRGVNLHRTDSMPACMTWSELSGAQGTSEMVSEWWLSWVAPLM